MLKIKSLELINYAGFDRKSLFDFTNTDGTFKSINVFFGPNGCGKSSGLNAISVLCRAKMYAKRIASDENLLLRKMQFHQDYDPSYFGFTKYTDKMEIIGKFEENDKDLIVHIKNDDIIRNDLLSRRSSDNCAFIDADHPINNSKFQIPSDRIDIFLTLAKAIYGYNCYLDKAVSSNGVESNKSSLKEALTAYANNVDKVKDIKSESTLTKEQIYSQISDAKSDDLAFYQDFIIEKGNIKVHYKAMSAGEKKIATLLRNLCDPNVMDNSDIVMIDNIELHVYWERHAIMLEKMMEIFPDKQFLLTTHSGTLLKYISQKYGNECLFDIEFIKGIKKKPSYTYW